MPSDETEIKADTEENIDDNPIDSSKKDDIDDVSEIKKYIKQSDEKIDKYQKQISELERKIRNK